MKQDNSSHGFRETRTKSHAKSLAPKTPHSKITVNPVRQASKRLLRPGTLKV